MIKNILLSGVGGQGIITMSKIITYALFKNGFDVKKSEIHGLSQRGGSVTSMIRYGEKVWSPVIPDNNADYVISLEKVETLRYTNLYSSDTSIIINNLELKPITVTAGKFDYPENIEKILSDNGFSNIHTVNAVEKSIKHFNSQRFSNIILVGCFSKLIDIEEKLWVSAIEANIKSKFVEKNLKAFEIGKKIITGDEK
ncbi:MAG: indolepyruvate oxidoreductase subunit beta [Candidatus Muiribacteriota bacterium]